MTSRFFRGVAGPLALALAAFPIAAPAQFVQNTAPTDADALAAQMRVLASDPNNLNAILTAGELTLKMGDPTAAGALFGRAERIDPRSGRLKAGIATMLVRSERPAQALARFAEAEAAGWPVARFAAERALAYDLIGENERAQRDYRLALKYAQDDETVRRYALSLGISGQADRAQQLLDPLLRRSDRAAWRDRAFVMAMNGDAAGAERIANTMMPGPVATGLAAFFQRLPAMSAVDRAFAVQFGEIRPSAERIADARFRPRLPPLGPDPDGPPVQLAQVAPPARSSREERRHGRRETAPAVQVAQAAPLPIPQPPVRTVQPFAAQRPPVRMVQALPQRPPVQMVQQVPVQRAPVPIVQPVPQRQPVPIVQPAQRQPVPMVQPTAQPPVRAVQPAPATVAPASPQPAPVMRAAEADTHVAPVAVAPPVPTPSAPPPIAPQPAPVAAAPVQLAATSVPAPERRVGSEDSILARIVAGVDIPPSEVARPAAAAPVAPRPEPARPVERPAPAKPKPAAEAPRAAADPAEGCAPTGRSRHPTRCATPAKPADATDDCAPKSSKSRRTPQCATPAKPVAPTEDCAPGTRKGRHPASCVAPPAAEDCPPPTKGRHAARTCAAAKPDAHQDESADPACAPPAHGAKNRRTPQRCQSSDDQPSSKSRDEAPADCPPAKRSAHGRDTRCTADDSARKKPDPARQEPARVWVQVAGGASQGDLAKAWSRAKTQAPTAFRGKQGWTTPLRATNRVLAGPFDDEDTAQAFVNALRKEGVSGFVFQSEPGQKVARLGEGK